MARRSIDNCLNIADLRIAAKRRAHKMVFDYIDGGADDEVTLRQNSSAFDRHRLRYKTLVGVDEIDPSITLLGQKLPVPFFCSPAAGNRLFHHEGERAVAKAASELGTIYSLSTLSSVSIEDIANLAPGPKWFQLYVWKDRGLVKEMLNRARDAGYLAMILTVDFAVTGNRERDPRNGFTIPPSYGLKQAIEALKAPFWTWDYLTKPAIRYANLSTKTAATSLNEFVAQQLHAGFSWRDAEWLLGEWNGPSVIKGIVRADDAKNAASLGFDAAMISNHGGRQLDHSIAPIEALPEIVQTVGDDLELIVDGGIRRGTDILKAIALGANAVSFARPYLYGLAADGLNGVQRAMSIMNDAVRRDMALLGVTSIAEIDRSFLASGIGLND